MKKTFVCSLCHHGVLGGALYLDDTSLTYKTNKLTVSAEYRNISLPLEDISKIEWKQVVFPVATIYMKNGKTYKFIIFNKKRFNKCYLEVKENEQRQ